MVVLIGTDSQQEGISGVTTDLNTEDLILIFSFVTNYLWCPVKVM